MADVGDSTRYRYGGTVSRADAGGMYRLDPMDMSIPIEADMRNVQQNGGQRGNKGE